MAELKYITRGNSSPRGKARVYFCCHDEDFGQYFDAVANEILGKQNCAVFYAENAVYDDDFLANLAQMQLFVMPVTAKLLLTENDAVTFGLKFAEENHIPVLPLMQEQGLEKYFARVFGDLQYLDKSSADKTAISYDKKLQDYLDSVLIGDELAEKIRAAFDAYVFLSYRKKDRKYAQELMRLIHKNDFCRDIAIWYDEFLTPGEDFNDAIKAALQKSGLFVLAVTPNLVNEPNYVISEEYPMAKKEEKPILPAELVYTDRAKLSENFEGIPEPTDAYSRDLSDALLKAVEKLAIKENDGSPQHDFFIGLAYLGGIDMEIDRERGLALIKSAAERGFAKAADKLFDIYLNGAGAKRDFTAAGQWLLKSVEIHKETCRQDNSYENALKYIYKKAAYAEYIKDCLGKASNAAEEYKDLYKFVQAAFKKYPTLKLRGILGNCSVQIAQMYSGNSDDWFFGYYLDSAISLLGDIKSEYEEQFAKNISAITLKDLEEYYLMFSSVSSLCFLNAIYCERKNDMDGAEKYILEGVEAAEYSAKHFIEDYDTQLTLVRAYSNAAKCYIKKKDFGKAEEYINLGLPKAAEIGEVTHSLYAGELVVSLRMLKALVYSEQGQQEKELECYLENVKNMEMSSLTPSMMGTLCLNYDKVVDISYERGDYSLCAAIAEKCFMLYSKILSEADFAKVQDRLVKILAKSRAKLGEAEAATELAIASFKAKNSAFQQYPSDKTALEHSESLYFLADIYYELRNYAVAAETYDKGLLFSKTVMMSYPNVGEINLENVVRAYGFMAKAYAKLGKKSDALHSIKKGVTIRKRVYKDLGSAASGEKYAACYEVFGEVYEILGKPKDAKSCYEKAAEIRKKL